jgi:hypothetical protein
MGQGQGTKGYLNRRAKTQDVTSRTEAHCRCSEGALGEVEEGAQEALTVRVESVDGWVNDQEKDHMWMFDASTARI